VRLSYVVDGPDDAPVLVLSGGLGTTLALWDGQVEPFAGRFRVVRHELPGHGVSPAPQGSVSVADIARGVVALLDELDAATAAFCGLSVGGMVGLWLGAEAGDRIDRLVLACTGATLGSPEAYAERAALVRARGTGAVVDGARERWFTPAFRDAEPARRVLDALQDDVSSEGYAACCEAVGAFDFRARLDEVASPALVLYGADDPLTPPEVVDELAEGVGAERVVRLEDAAHLACVEQPHAFSAAVLGFLEERAAA